MRVVETIAPNAGSLMILLGREDLLVASVLVLARDRRGRPMDVDDAPGTVDPAQHHGLHHARVNGSPLKLSVHLRT